MGVRHRQRIRWHPEDVPRTSTLPHHGSLPIRADPQVITEPLLLYLLSVVFDCLLPTFIYLRIYTHLYAFSCPFTLLETNICGDLHELDFVQCLDATPIAPSDKHQSPRSSHSSLPHTPLVARLQVDVFQTKPPPSKFPEPRLPKKAL